MSISLTGPIASYFSARQAFNIDAILEPFAENAVVKDENEEHRGLRAIRFWVERTTAQYHATVKPQSATDASDETIVSGLVSGDFEGSPVLLEHTFTLAGQKISRLEIS
jgi:hypothetical protein